MLVRLRKSKSYLCCQFWLVMKQFLSLEIKYMCCDFWWCLEWGSTKATKLPSTRQRKRESPAGWTKFSSASFYAPATNTEPVVFPHMHTYRHPLCDFFHLTDFTSSLFLLPDCPCRPLLAAVQSGERDNLRDARRKICHFKARGQTASLAIDWLVLLYYSALCMAPFVGGATATNTHSPQALSIWRNERQEAASVGLA